MKEVHLEKNEKLEDVDENEKQFRLYGELTSNDIELLKRLKATHLDFGNLSNPSFPYTVFSYFKSLTLIILPKNLKCLENDCFYQCRNLEEVDAFNCTDLNSISKECFACCYSLKSVKLSDTITIIEDSAFAYCKNLETITLSKSVGDCLSLKTIFVSKSVTSLVVMHLRIAVL